MQLAKMAPYPRFSCRTLRAVLTTSGGEWDFRERATEALDLWNLTSTSLIKDMPFRTKREGGYTIACTGIAASADERVLASNSPAQVHQLRILTVLERIADSEARRVLESLSWESSHSRLAQEAQASLRRLGVRIER